MAKKRKSRKKAPKKRVSRKRSLAAKRGWKKRRKLYGKDGRRG